MRFFPVAAAFAASLLLALPVQAQLFRTYLSPGGNDADPCTVAQPCRLLPAALAAVQSGGEIWMLDSANYNTGPVTVNKSVTILAIPGALGSVVALGGSALVIANNMQVTLRNLNVLPFPGSEAQVGITLGFTDTVRIEDCHVTGFSTGKGMLFLTSGTSDVTVLRSVIADNATGIHLRGGSQVSVLDSLLSNNSGFGVLVDTAGPPGPVLSLTRSIVRGSDVGVKAIFPSGLVNVIATDSRFESNAARGLWLDGAGVHATLIRNVVTGSTTGLAVLNGAFAALTGNTLSHNTTGAQIGPGSSGQSAGTNFIRNNTTDDMIGTLTGVGQQ
jgi:nitrous oxidase accessory protein NosD